MDTARISPTAHYTGYVWARHGLSWPQLVTSRGRAFYQALRPANAALRALGAANLDDMLLARHRVIDHLLSVELEAGRVAQVIEIASGLSPRGARFSADHPRATYVEGDLPAMAADKRARLERAGLLRDNLRVIQLDAFADGGPHSLTAVADQLDPSLGTAVVSEGLIPYVELDMVVALWRRVAATLARFPFGLYLCDVLTDGEGRRVPMFQPFRHALSLFARGRVHFPFADADAVTQALLDAGFADATAPLAGSYRATLPVAAPAQSAYVRVAAARTPTK